jgi:hypothetical protein
MPHNSTSRCRRRKSFRRRFRATAVPVPEATAVPVPEGVNMDACWRAIINTQQYIDMHKALSDNEILLILLDNAHNYETFQHPDPNSPPRQIFRMYVNYGPQFITDMKRLVETIRDSDGW